MLLVVDLVLLKRRVVDENLHGVRAGFLEAAYGHQRQQVGLATRAGVVIAALFVAEQQAGTFGARFSSRESPLRIEQDGARVRGQNLGDGEFELLHHLVGDVALLDALAGGNRLLQGAALVHRGRRDDAALVRQRLHVLDLFLGNLHAHEILPSPSNRPRAEWRAAGNPFAEAC